MSEFNAQSIVDYYAGISALLVVILFAKFTTHQVRQRKSDSATSTEISGRCPGRWVYLHWLTVGVSWLAIGACLAELGWGGLVGTSEDYVRKVVAAIALIMALFLALDAASA